MRVYVSERQLQAMEVEATEIKHEAKDLLRYGLASWLVGTGVLAMIFLPNFPFLLALFLVLVGFALKPNRPARNRPT